jgi:hypothetical protein
VASAASFISTAVDVVSEIDFAAMNLDATIGENAAIRQEVINMTHKCQETVISMWDEDDHPWETGEYRESISTEFETKPSGFFVGTVYTNDNKCFWIEYGAEHMPEFAPFTRACLALGGHVIEHEEIEPYSNQGNSYRRTSESSSGPGSLHRGMSVSA